LDKLNVRHISISGIADLLT